MNQYFNPNTSKNTFIYGENLLQYIANSELPKLHIIDLYNDNVAKFKKRKT